MKGVLGTNGKRRFVADMEDIENKRYMLERDVVKHWKYFLSLEKKLKETEDYVYHGIKLIEDKIVLINGSVFSNEFKQLILLTGAEYESLSREMLKIPSGNIGKIIYGLLTRYPEIINLEVTTDYVSIKPMCGCYISGEKGCGLGWWASYNKLKHGGESCFDNATLENSILSLASLYALNLYNIESITGEFYYH